MFEFQFSFYGWGFLMSESREGLELTGTNIIETLHHEKGEQFVTGKICGPNVWTSGEHFCGASKRSTGRE